MKNLNQYINEGRINAYDLKKYIKSTITNSYNYQQYIIYLKSIIEGLDEGAKENMKYYDGQEAEDTQKFLTVIDDLNKVLKKA